MVGGCGGGGAEGGSGTWGGRIGMEGGWRRSEEEERYVRGTRRYHTDLSISNQLQSGVLGNMEWVGTKIPCNENAIHIQILT